MGQERRRGDPTRASSSERWPRDRSGNPSRFRLGDLSGWRWKSTGGDVAGKYSEKSGLLWFYEIYSRLI